MAKHKQLWLKGSKGKLAGTTFYQTAGVTIQREINYDPSNPRTDKQMTQRTKLANLVNMYRAGKSFFPRAFENKKALESDYNKFVSYNLTNSPVFLTKGEASKGIFVPEEYQISQGSLPSLMSMYTDGGEAIYSEVSGGTMSAATTVAQYFAALKAECPFVEDGDQLSIVGWSSGINGQSFDKLEIILSSEDTSTMTSKMGGRFSWAPSDGIKYEAPYDCLGAAAVLSRTVAGKTLVSTQLLIIESDSFHDAHVGAAAQAAAINSYGANKKVFLDNK